MTRALWAAALLALYLAVHTAGLAVLELQRAPCACSPAPDAPGAPRLYPAHLSGTSTASLRAP